MDDPRQKFYRGSTETLAPASFEGRVRLNKTGGTHYEFNGHLSFERSEFGLILCRIQVPRSSEALEFINNAITPFDFFPSAEFLGRSADWQLSIARGFYESGGINQSSSYLFNLNAGELCLSKPQVNVCNRFEVGFTNLVMPQDRREIGHEGSRSYAIYLADYWLADFLLQLRSVPDYYKLIEEEKNQATYFVSAIGLANCQESPEVFKKTVDVFLCQYWIATRNQTNVAWIRGYLDDELVWEKLYSPSKRSFSLHNNLVPLHKIGDGSSSAPIRMPLRDFIESTFARVRELTQQKGFTKTIGLCMEAHHMLLLETAIMMSMLVLDRIHEYVLESDEKATPILSKAKQQLVEDISRFDEALAARAGEALRPMFPSFQQVLETLVCHYDLEGVVTGITKLRRISNYRNRFMHGQDLPKKDEDRLPEFLDKLMHVVDVVMLKAVGYVGPYHNIDTRQQIRWLP